MSSIITSVVFSCVLWFISAASVRKDRTVASLRDVDVLKLTDPKSDNKTLLRLRASDLEFAADDATQAQSKGVRASKRAINGQSRLNKTTSKRSLVTDDTFEPKKKGNGAIELRGIKGFKHENGILYRIRIKDSKNKYVGFAGYTENTGTNEVVPGDYTVFSGYKLPVKVQAGKKTTVHLGGVFVAGKGNSLFQIWLPDRKTRVRMNLATRKGHVLLPGKYKVLLGEGYRDVRIVAGKVTQVKTGQLQPIGDVWQLFTRNGKRRLHGSTTSKRTIDFFPGTYLVEFGITNRMSFPVVIESGKKTVINRVGKK